MKHSNFRILLQLCHTFELESVQLIVLNVFPCRIILVHFETRRIDKYQCNFKMIRFLFRLIISDYVLLLVSAVHLSVI